MGCHSNRRQSLPDFPSRAGFSYILKIVGLCWCVDFAFNNISGSIGLSSNDFIADRRRGGLRICRTPRFCYGRIVMNDVRGLVKIVGHLRCPDPLADRATRPQQFTSGVSTSHPSRLLRIESGCGMSLGRDPANHHKVAQSAMRTRRRKGSLSQQQNGDCLFS